jgi:hypothetical protein
MTETPTERQRRRWITIGEIIAVAGLIISGLALWNSWKSGPDGPTAVVEQRRPVPLVLRGKIEDGGRVLRIAPVEEGHALEQLILVSDPPATGRTPYGSDPVVSASDVESWLPAEGRKDMRSITIRATARYVEQGQMRQSVQRYRIDFEWKDGGLFSGKSLRLTGFGRA